MITIQTLLGMALMFYGLVHTLVIGTSWTVEESLQIEAEREQRWQRVFGWFKQGWFKQ